MDKLSRRDFLSVLNRIFVATGLTAVLGPIVAYFYPPKLEEVPSEPVLAGTLTELPVGASKTVRYGRYPAIIIHTSAGLKAYSAVCTHFACLVKWEAESDQIVCPCHDAIFDPADGRVIVGPPPTPLESLPIEVIGGQIYVGGTA